MEVVHKTLTSESVGTLVYICESSDNMILLCFIGLYTIICGTLT
jgi:hypothetical protein